MIRFVERETGGKGNLVHLPVGVDGSPELHVVTNSIVTGGPATVIGIDPNISGQEVRILSEREEIPLEQTHALVLAGGIAMRMKSSDPKQLIPITPSIRLIDFPMLILAQAGIQDITLSCVRYTVDPITQHIREHTEVMPAYGGSRFFVREEAEGVIPAIRDPVERFNLKDKPLIILHGDEVLFVNLKEMYEYHTNKCHPITVCMVSNPISKNKVFLQTDENMKVIQVGRYPDDVPLSAASRFGYPYTLTGLWIIDPDYIDFLKSSIGADPFIFEACRQGILFGYRNTGLFFNCNTQEDIAIARRALERAGKYYE